MGSYLRLAAFIFTISLVQGAARYKITNTLPSRPEPGTNVNFKEDISSEERARQQAVCDDTLISPALREEIANYQPVATQIINYILEGPFKGKAFNEMVRLIDEYPIRLSGEQNLEDSIDHMIDIMTNEMNFDNVRGEQALVPHWIR